MNHSSCCELLNSGLLCGIVKILRLASTILYNSCTGIVVAINIDFTGHYTLYAWYELYHKMSG